VTQTKGSPENPGRFTRTPVPAVLVQADVPCASG
jgi:hypothetical protein